MTKYWLRYLLDILNSPEHFCDTKDCHLCPIHTDCLSLIGPTFHKEKAKLIQETLNKLSKEEIVEILL